VGDAELVILIAGAWCAVVLVTLALLAVAGRADDRFEAEARELVRTPPVPPRFTQRAPERALPKRPTSGRPTVGA